MYLVNESISDNFHLSKVVKYSLISTIKNNNKNKGI